MQWAEVTARPSLRKLRQFAGLWLVFFCGLALCLTAHSINQCSAQTTSIWTGASCATVPVTGDCEWGTDENWAPPPPDPAPHAPTKPPNDGTANIVFNGPVGLTPLLAGDWNVNSILFDVSAGAFVNAGGPNTLTIQNGITNNSLNPQTFVSTRISLGAPQTWAANQSNLLFRTGSTVATNSRGRAENPIASDAPPSAASSEPTT